MKEFLQGFACAIACLAKTHNQPTMASDIMLSCGITLTDLKEAGVEGQDMRVIENIFKEPTK